MSPPLGLTSIHSLCKRNIFMKVAHNDVRQPLAALILVSYLSISQTLEGWFWGYLHTIWVPPPPYLVFLIIRNVLTDLLSTWSSIVVFLWFDINLTSRVSDKGRCINSIKISEDDIVGTIVHIFFFYEHSMSLFKLDVRWTLIQVKKSYL